MGIISNNDIETIIERVMAAGFSSVGLAEMKSFMAGMLFDTDSQREPGAGYHSMGTIRSTNAMEKSLIIVESPAKAKTINKYLGKEYVVEASVGHIKNLPKSKMSVDVEKDFDVVYETISGKEDVVAKLRTKAEKASAVYIATDPDREGEAIAAHIADEIKDVATNIRRFFSTRSRNPASKRQWPTRTRSTETS